LACVSFRTWRRKEADAAARASVKDDKDTKERGMRVELGGRKSEQESRGKDEGRRGEERRVQV
jgi:hypothetical protein